MKASKDLHSLLKQLNPKLHNNTYCYVFSPEANEKYSTASFCVVNEKEGVTYIMPQEKADALGLHYSFIGKLITLQVFSDLEAIGLTMAVSTTLTKAGIPCNVIAGYHHDHIVVPEKKAEQAMQLLNSLSA